MEETSDDIVVFAFFDSSIDANIAKTKLDAYGIPCFLTEENMAGLYPGQSFNAFKIRLHIFAADRDRAARILQGEPQAELGEQNVACPRCKSERTERSFPKSTEGSLFYALFGLLVPHKKINRCLECGCEF